MKRPAGNAAVLFNARAGRGRGQAAAERAARFMVARGWRIVARRSTPAAENDRRALICHLAAQSDRLVVVGGDGTLRETAATIHGKPGMPTLAFVPMGNANVLARELGIPRDPAEATRLITAEHTLAVDAARIIPDDRSG